MALSGGAAAGAPELHVSPPFYTEIDDSMYQVSGIHPLRVTAVC